MKKEENVKKINDLSLGELRMVTYNYYFCKKHGFKFKLDFSIQKIFDRLNFLQKKQNKEFDKNYKRFVSVKKSFGIYDNDQLESVLILSKKYCEFIHLFLSLLNEKYGHENISLSDKEFEEIGKSLKDHDMSIFVDDKDVELIKHEQ